LFLFVFRRPFRFGFRGFLFMGLLFFFCLLLLSSAFFLFLSCFLVLVLLLLLLPLLLTVIDLLFLWHSIQEAVAVSFEQAPKKGYFESFIEDMTRRREKLAKVLHETGLEPTIPDGSYFILADTSKVKVPQELRTDSRHDFNVCRYLTSEAKVTAIPPSAFYSSHNEHLPANLARFCFIKSDQMLDEAAANLSKHFNQ